MYLSTLVSLNVLGLKLAALRTVLNHLLSQVEIPLSLLKSSDASFMMSFILENVAHTNIVSALISVDIRVDFDSTAFSCDRYINRLFCTIPTLFFLLVYATIPTSEYSALQELYNSTDGRNWHWRNSTSHGPKWFDGSSHPCSLPFWQGLTCSCNTKKQCNIVKIQLTVYGMRGALPNSIANFTQLTDLELGQNLLNSTLPSELCRLTKLESLSLASNLLTGSIPSNIGKIVCCSWF